jgi:hypothetical protein
MSWTTALIKHVTTFPEVAVETTRAFFESRTGVSQAL